MRAHTAQAGVDAAYQQASSAVAALRARCDTFLDGSSLPPPAPAQAEPLPYSVLIVEDSAAVARPIARMLTDDFPGVAVALAATLTEARRLLGLAPGAPSRPPPFGVVLLDLNLPDGDGWTLAREIARQCWVVLVSGAVDKEQIGELKAATGAKAAFCKPVRMEALSAEVGRAWAGP